MKVHEIPDLQDCPYCGGPGILEEEGGWCWYAVCADCGAQTASFEFRTPEESADAARKATSLWNNGKIVRSDIGE